MSVLRRMAKWRAMRALVLALTCALGSAGTLPLWATLLGVEDVHVCSCSHEHHDCVCARCHTDPDAAMKVSSETLKNRCGEDDVVFGGQRLLAIASPSLESVAVALVSARLPSFVPVSASSSRGAPEPLTPPPRSAA
jgi:hypothetical protein